MTPDADRLRAQKDQDEQLALRHLDSLQKFLLRKQYADEAVRLDIAGREQRARQVLEAIRQPDYLESLRGTIGRQPRFS